MRSINPVSEFVQKIYNFPSLSSRRSQGPNNRDCIYSTYFDSGVGHIGGGAGQGRLWGPDGEQVVDTGRSTRPHGVGGPADQAAKIHFILRRVLNNAFCAGNGNIRILIV